MENNGRIASQGFPLNNYENKLNCFWKIWAPINHGINLTFNLTSLADEVECSDKIQIFRGFRPSDRNKRFQDICGVSHQAVTHTLNFNIVLIRFMSDWSQTSAGFLLSYSFFKISDSEHAAVVDTLQNDLTSITDMTYVLSCGCSEDHGFPISSVQYQKLSSNYPWLATVKVGLY